MLNELKIKIDPYKEVNSATLNGKPLSPYNELSNYLKEPFLKWAYKLLDVAEREINDDYQLSVIGERFETMFLEDLQTDNDACKNYLTERFPINLSPANRFKLVAGIAKEYHLPLPAREFQTPVCLDTGFITGNQLIKQTQPEQAVLCITENREKATEAVRSGTPLIILLSTRNSVSVHNGICLWEVQIDRFQDAAIAAIDRFVTVQAVIKAVRMIQKTGSIDSDDQQKAEVALSVDPYIRIPDIPIIEAGVTFDVPITVYPSESILPKIRSRSSNPTVLSVKNLQLQALAPGKVIVDFYREEEIIPFARKEITVSSDNYVRQIELHAPETSTSVGMMQKIVAYLKPEGADDVNTLIWETSDPVIGEIDSEGNFTANHVGSVTIRASTEHAEQLIEIEILPKVQYIRSSETQISLFVGEMHSIEAKVFPLDCYDNRYHWISSNPHIVKVIELEDGSTAIQASSFGDCVLTCITLDGSCSDTCQVHVESTFRRKKRSRSFLACSFVALIFAFLCAIIARTTGAMIGAVAAALFSILAILKNKNDLIWSVLIISATTVIAFGVRSGWFT